VRKKFPHDGVYTRLRRSKIHGVGVFAIRKILKGTGIFPDDNKPIEWIRKQNLGSMPKEVRRLYNDFCIIKDNGETFGCPKSFNQLTPAWFLNKPKRGKRPNVGCKRDYTFYALREIDVGEELTVDYRTFSEEPQQSRRS
jgi:SET domain-containing protein